jgi:hypothetical protein
VGKRPALVKGERSNDMKRQLKLLNEATLEIACQMPVSSATQEANPAHFYGMGGVSIS